MQTHGNSESLPLVSVYGCQSNGNNLFADHKLCYSEEITSGSDMCTLRCDESVIDSGVLHSKPRGHGVTLVKTQCRLDIR